MNYIALIIATTAVILAVYVIKAVFIPCERTEDAFVVLPVCDHVEDVELRVRRLVSACGRMRGLSIVIADFGADSETAEICDRLCREFGRVKIIEGSRIGNFLMRAEHSHS